MLRGCVSVDSVLALRGCVGIKRGRYLFEHIIIRRAFVDVVNAKNFVGHRHHVTSVVLW